MRFVELFAGAGGLSLGLERAGLRCVAHAEIESHARAVLRHRWPEVPLFGDVTTLTGADLPPCDLLSGGSPCQDLSVAGKRAGLVDGARSSLFFHQARLWTECGAPYLLWENVAGALSSNAGRDFALVLSTLVGATIAVPGDGWRRGGVASGPAAVAAWRVCDLRYFGVGGFGPPQRRVRVFVIAARAGGADPAEVLALRQGVCRHPDPREAAGEGSAGEVGASVAGSLGSHRTGGHRTDLDNSGCYPVQLYDTYNHDRAPVSATLSNGESGRPLAVTGYHTHALTGEGCDASEGGNGIGDRMSDAVLGCLTDGGRSHGAGDSVDNTPVVVQSGLASDECLPSLPASPGGSPTGHNRDGLIVATIAAKWSKGSGGYAGDEHHNLVAQVHPTLNTSHFGKHAGCNQHVTEIAGLLDVIERPRRLMPTECERLMGWPDDHTATGVNERGRTYLLKDTPRYRLCGNGVGAPQAEWIGRRLVEALAGCPA